MDFPADRRRLRPPQVEIIRRVEAAIRARKSETIVVMSSRQTGKNECFGMIGARFLWQFARRGGTYIRTAPTWPTMYANSQRRLETHLRADPFDRSRKSQMFNLPIYEHGAATLILYSSDKSTQVLGATADRALDMDEAHKVDPTKFREEFRPMTASTAAPSILWGVAGNGGDLLAQERKKLEAQGRHDCVLRYPWPVWAELVPAYKTFVEAERERLGEDHPVFQTQYALNDVDAIGGFWNDKQRRSIFESGQHGRLYYPRSTPDLVYYALIDFGGADEDFTSDEETRATKPGQDSTAAIMVEADYRLIHPYLQLPTCRLVDFLWITGRPLDQTQDAVVGWLAGWNALIGVADARGLGEQAATTINARFPGVLAYKATSETVHEDCSLTLAMANHDLIQAPTDDGSPEFTEFKNQIGWAARRYTQGQRMKIAKPGADKSGNGGDPERHIDFAKCLTYLPRALSDATSGFSMEAPGESVDQFVPTLGPQY